MKSELEQEPSQLSKELRDTNTSYTSFNFPILSGFSKPVLPTDDRMYNIILGISPTQDYHRDNSLKTTIELLKQIFPKLRVILFIGDWVQKYLIAKENAALDEQALREKAEKLGDEWLDYVIKNKFIEIIEDETSSLDNSAGIHCLKIKN
jgi:hypothetical protein